MKRMSRKSLLLLFPLLLITACATGNKTWVPLNLEKIGVNEKARTTTTVYIRNYGQALFMNLAAVILGSVSAMVGELGRQSGLSNNQNNDLVSTSKAIQDLAESIDAADKRKKSGEFEQKMGDYSLYYYFLKSFDAEKDSIKYFDISMNFDQTVHKQIIDRLYTYNNEKLDSSFTMKLADNGVKYISAIEFQYGIGARAGKEQFSLTKKYRPFVRVVGLIKDSKTNEFVWGNKITIFSETMYRGVKEAKNAPREELIPAFELITKKLVEVLIKDINGERYISKESLVGF